jgi:sulfoxide reductase heme-binding subunit YedZ
MARAVPLPWLKPAIIVGALAPVAAIAVRAAQGALGADPIAQALNQLGLIALVFLVAALACTPLKSLAGWTWPIRVRRLLGLLAFFYATLHVATYVALDQTFDWGAILDDVTKRRFIYVGLTTFLLLVPLAVTSTSGWVRRLGFVGWKRLHRLAYAATVLAIVHFTWRVKRDVREPLTYGAIVLGLLLVRVATATHGLRGEARALR